MTLSHENPGRLKDFAQLFVQAAGRLALIGLVMILVSVWALSELVYEFGKWITRGGNPMEE